MVIFFMVRRRCKWFKMELKCSHCMNNLFANHEQQGENQDTAKEFLERIKRLLGTIG